MIYPPLTLVVVPEDAWTRRLPGPATSLARCDRELTAISRRVSKRVQRKVERDRLRRWTDKAYAVSDALMLEGTAKPKPIPAVHLEGWLEVLRLLVPQVQPGKPVPSPFVPFLHPPGSLADRARATSRVDHPTARIRAGAFAKLAEQHCGVVEMVTPMGAEGVR